MTPDPDSTWQRRLISCSSDRTVFALVGPDGAPDRVVKRFETGTELDTERERDAADLCAGPGIPKCLGTGTDPNTGRPTIEFEWTPGRDLARILRDHGPISSPRAIAIARALAHVLRRIAAGDPHHAPLGIVHRDVKPANVIVDEDDGRVTVHLIDLEHAQPIRHTAPVREFTGGTLGFAPPEAQHGVAPTTSFDVYGFGCCLRMMLTGEWPRGRDVPVFCGHAMRWAPDPLRDLVIECMSAAPEQRPTWDAISARLEACANEADEFATADRARIAYVTGDLSAAAAALDELAGFAARHGTRVEPLRRALTQRQRLAAFIADTPTHALESLDQIAAMARRTASTLQRFPGNPEWVARCTQVREALVAELPDVPATAKQWERRGRFEDAGALLDDCRRAIDATHRLGGIPIRGFDADAVPPIVRDPAKVLDLARSSLEAAKRAHGALIERVEAAEAALDRDAIERALGDATHAYGGASEITVGLKERLHDFEFALIRIGSGLDVLDSCAALLDSPTDLAPTRKFVQRASEWGSTSKITHCRILLREFEGLCADRPHVQAIATHALEALVEALSTVTDEAWTLVESAHSSLNAVPIPIRPLQGDLNRLDHMELIGALIDRPDRTRSDLLDRIESIRLGIERARATRDRLARGAQQAMDEGHLTTALYELERVASNFDDETSQAHGQPIRDRYARARQLKEEVETALRQNHELATKLQETKQDGSDPDLRIELLRERERVLEFVRRHVGEHRSEPYEADLNAVRFERFTQTLSLGETRYRSCEPSIRGVVASQVATELAVQVPASGWTDEQRESARQSIDLWRARASEPTHVPTTRRRPKRSQTWVAIAGSVLAAIALSWGWTAWAGHRATSLEEIASELRPALSGSTDPASFATTTARLDDFVASMPGKTSSSQQAAARRLLDVVRAEPHEPRFLTELSQALRGLDDVTTEHDAALVMFGRAAHSIALQRAVIAGIVVADHLDAHEDSPLAPTGSLMRWLRTQ